MKEQRGTTTNGHIIPFWLILFLFYYFFPREIDVVSSLSSGEKKTTHSAATPTHACSLDRSPTLFLFLLLSFLKDSVSFEAIKLSSFIIFRIVAVG